MGPEQVTFSQDRRALGGLTAEGPADGTAELCRGGRPGYGDPREGWQCPPFGAATVESGASSLRLFLDRHKGQQPGRSQGTVPCLTRDLLHTGLGGGQGITALPGEGGTGSRNRATGWGHPRLKQTPHQLSSAETPYSGLEKMLISCLTEMPTWQ